VERGWRDLWGDMNRQYGAPHGLGILLASAACLPSLPPLLFDALTVSQRRGGRRAATSRLWAC